MSSYLHVMDGRLRVKVPETRRSVAKALHVEQLIQTLPGIIRVTANPTTGNVLVLFDSEQLIVFCQPITSAQRTGLDLAAIGRHC